jgi:Fe2+ transport system protein FeoA
MGDPVEITVRGFALSLRKQEAETLLVERFVKN